MGAGTLTSPAVSAPSAGWRRAVGSIALRAEDWLLAGWVLLAAPLIALAGGSAGPFDSGHPIAGVALLIGFCGAVACLATRNSPADGASPAAGGSTSWNVMDSAAIGPLVGGLMLVGGTGFAELGLSPEAVLYPSVAAVLALSVMQSRLPRVPTAVRRAFVTPYLLSAGGLFWGIVHAVTRGSIWAPHLVRRWPAPRRARPSSWGCSPCARPSTTPCSSTPHAR